MEETEIEGKIILIGEASVGKTSIVNKIMGNEINRMEEPTVCVGNYFKTLEVHGSKVTLQIWDTAGQEKYRTLVPLYYKNSIVAVIVFSLTSRDSFDSIEFWTENLKNATETMPYLIICGNKVDLSEQREVKEDEAEALANKYNADYFETSANTGEMIQQLELRLSELLIQHFNDVNESQTINITREKESNDSCC